MKPRTIDLNADLGEDPRALASGQEAALLGVVTSANVACGGHAGDEHSMRAVVRLALARGVAVGAHPSYPDREGFGRAPQDLSPDEIEATVAAQIARLGEIARAEGIALTHVKPHGALYHAASQQTAVAQAIARAAARWSPDLVLVGQAGSHALEVWRAQGFRVAGEAFADRAYEPDGSLRPRSQPGALLTDPATAAAQAVALARGRTADTLCVHGDTPGAVAIAQAVRTALLAANFRVRALGTGGTGPRC